ncbi:MAG: NAD(P)/FAD-dependent oxidoreductase [Bacteroidota bacterium]
MKDIIIIGGGMAGLTAAHYLHKANKEFLLLEASDRVGGRVKTDKVDGFLLDQGFQVLLTTYPEVKAVLDYDALQLKAFLPGALILQENGKKSQLGDPLRWLGSTFSTLFNGIGTWGDKFRILALRSRLKNLSIDTIFQQEEITTLQALQDYGFSQEMIEVFFKPFLRGIFLEKDLSTSRRMFDFVFKLFSKGDTAIPTNGIEAIPQQIASRLPQQNIRVQQKVTQIKDGKVYLASGEVLETKQLLMATDAQNAAQLLQQKIKNTAYESTLNVYFKTKVAPFQKSILALNAVPNSLVNNCTVMSNLSEQFAPQGEHLISTSIVGNIALDEAQLIEQIKRELKTHFGEAVTQWQHLRTYNVKYALPKADTIKNTLSQSEIKLAEGLYICGDHLMNGSLNAAMKSGRLAAELMLKDR